MKFRCRKCKKLTSWEDGFITQGRQYVYCSDAGIILEMFCERCYPFKEKNNEKVK